MQDILKYLKLKVRPADADLRQDLRVSVHEALQILNPIPCSDVGPLAARVQGRAPLSRKELADLHDHFRSQVSETQHLAYAAAKVRDPDHAFTVDAHHYVQKEHGKALWLEADRLVNEVMP